MSNYKKLKEVIEFKGYKFYNKGDYNVNLIWCRNSDVFDNQYTDELFMAYKINGIARVDTIPCSTKAG